MFHLFKRKKANDIIKEQFDKIEKEIAVLTKRRRSFDLVRTEAVIDLIENNLDDFKKELDEFAEEEKEFIGFRPAFDAVIDDTVLQTKVLADDLKKSLSSYKNDLKTESRDEDRIAILQLIGEEEAKFKALGDSYRKNRVEELKHFTAENMTRSVATGPTGSTGGVAWSRIERVVRLLGGQMVLAGKHPDKITFPLAARPVPLSKDMKIKRLAYQIVKQLIIIHPKKKITVNQLITAFGRGDLVFA